jgi:hypothetical protein
MIAVFISGRMKGRSCEIDHPLPVGCTIRIPVVMAIDFTRPFDPDAFDLNWCCIYEVVSGAGLIRYTEFRRLQRMD